MAAKSPDTANEGDASAASQIAERAHQIQALAESLRPGQRALAEWQSGPLAVSAVPVSGKSTGMAAGAAIAIANHQLHARKQLVLVTFTRSAAANLKAKVRQHLKELSLPQNSFVVHTLHGLSTFSQVTE